MFARDVFEEELSQAAWKTVCSAVPTKRRTPSRPPCWKAALENYRYLSLEIKTLAAARREWPHDNWMIYQITTNYVKIPVEPAHVLLRGLFFFFLSFRKRSCCCRKAALVFPSARVRAAQSKQEDGDLWVWTGSQNNLLKTQRAALG